MRHTFIGAMIAGKAGMIPSVKDMRPAPSSKCLKNKSCWLNISSGCRLLKKNKGKLGKWKINYQNSRCHIYVVTGFAFSWRSRKSLPQEKILVLVSSFTTSDVVRFSTVKNMENSGKFLIWWYSYRSVICKLSAHVILSINVMKTKPRLSSWRGPLVGQPSE